MGIGFSFIAQKPKKNLFGSFRKKQDNNVQIAAVISSFASSYGVEGLMQATPADVGDRLAIHYCEEWLDYEETDERIVLMGRTSTCGPGYHAFVVEALERVKSQLGIVFGEDDEHFDETGYFVSRDYSALQQAHTDWLKALARSVADRESESRGSELISMAIGGVTPIGSDLQILTPRGPVAREWFSNLAKATDGDLLALASEWFPWWERMPTARDWLRMGKTLMWVDVPWHVPAGDNERVVMQAALESCKKAKLVDPTLDIPTQELSELEALLAPKTPQSRRPGVSGIGYRRRQCRWPLGSGWTIELPGYWYEFQDGENGGLMFDDQNIWVSSYTVERKGSEDGAKLTPLELSNLKKDEQLVFEDEDDERRYRLTMPVQNEGEFVYFLEVTKVDGLLTLTFAGNDKEWEKQIQGIARTVR